MVKHTNVLSKTLLQLVKSERERIQKDNVWRVSQLFWDEKILDNVISSCVSAKVSEQLTKLIVLEIKDKLPEFNDLLIQHYVWLPGSGISTHRDRGYNFGATIYLNENWNINCGGIFLWRSDTNSEYTALSPTYNSMIVNTQSEEHLVTPVSFKTNEFRYTLQIWSDRK